MRYLAAASIISLSVAALAFSACSSSSSGGTGGSATGGTNNGGKGGVLAGGGSGGATGGSGGTLSGGGSGGTSNTGGSGQCAATGASCANNCFDQAGGCDPDCTAGSTGPCCSDYQSACVANAVTLPAGCVDPNAFLALCNPTDNSPCSGTAGAACDFAGGGLGVTCYSSGNNVQGGGQCDVGAANGDQFCVGGYTCDVPQDGSGNTQGICKKWCCADTDCNPGETCTSLNPNVGTLGVCDTGGGGTGGTGGTGGSAGASTGGTAGASTDGGA